MPIRRSLIMVMMAGLTFSFAARTHACGHCKEDKIAATYDFAVVSAAHRRGHTIVYAELQGLRAPQIGLATWIRRQVEACRGVIPGTSRVSLDPAALSFVCDPRQISVASAMRNIEGSLARRGLKVSLIESQ
jgi:hypothetical protein